MAPMPDAPAEAAEPFHATCLAYRPPFLTSVRGRCPPRSWTGRDVRRHHYPCETAGYGGPGGSTLDTETRFQTSSRRTNSSVTTIETPTCRVERRRGRAVLTSMDSRIDPLRMLGLAPGGRRDFAQRGARVADVVLRTLVLTSSLLGVNRVMVVPHTDCLMTVEAEDEVHRAIGATGRSRHPQPRISHDEGRVEIRAYAQLNSAKYSVIGAVVRVPAGGSDRPIRSETSPVAGSDAHCSSGCSSRWTGSAA